MKKKISQQDQKRLKAFVQQKIGDSQDAEDIFQETLIDAFDCLPLFKGQSSFFTWLCGIAKHEIADYYRKKKIKRFLFSHLPWLENLAAQALGPEQLLLRKDFEERIKATLESLSEGYQQVLRLKYYQGLTVKQIALKLNETSKAIESRLARARQAFAQAFLTYPA